MILPVQDPTQTVNFGIGLGKRPLRNPAPGVNVNMPKTQKRSGNASSTVSAITWGLLAVALVVAAGTRAWDAVAKRVQKAPTEINTKPRLNIQVEKIPNATEIIKRI